jgi:hypothetical protein
MTFESGLYTALNNLPVWNKPFQARLATTLEKMIQTPHDAAIMASLERYVEARLGFAPGTVVNWSQGAVAGSTAIDWTTILTFIEQFLPVLLSILGLFIPFPLPPIPVPPVPPTPAE